MLPIPCTTGSTAVHRPGDAEENQLCGQGTQGGGGDERAVREKGGCGGGGSLCCDWQGPWVGQVVGG